MAKTLEEWIATDVAALTSLEQNRKLYEEYFFRDPMRVMYVDSSYFFSPADGVIIYQTRVTADGPLIDIKGVSYSLRDAMRSPDLTGEWLVIGIFMTQYDVHVNRVPYSGILSYRSLPSLETHNSPMLGVETALLEGAIPWTQEAQYLHNNQRMINRIYSPGLQLTYYVLQIADYDVDDITPFETSQNSVVEQNERFSQIRCGSQVDLILPLSDRFTFETLQKVGTHVEGGVDRLVKILPVDSAIQ